MRKTVPFWALATTALLATLTACGEGSGTAGTSVGDDDLGAVLAQVHAAGKPAYYLGPTVDRLPLTLLDVVEENAPAFQVEADYGTCASTGEGGCSAPVVVSTNDRRPDVQGTHCRRLEPQLGVAAGVLMGELTLVTGNVVITVSDFRGRDAGDDAQAALRLLTELRAVGDPRPVRRLPPPDAASSAWLDAVCGTTAGAEVSHDLGAGPGLVDSSPCSSVATSSVDLVVLAVSRLAW
ncbi:hypothetical protein [Pedococcus sp. 5OH_020]|uniref:hypothetical protein n=1 Tax=Pedococcus sp. 5OH_020 TaxID=2989814 RepID=UPI0022EA0B29|nr:hypothetical protein [Pedococcus sp. 5OH_020]